MVGVNSVAISTPETPFGGVKESGYGHEGGIEGLEAYTVTQVHLAGVSGHLRNAKPFAQTSVAPSPVAGEGSRNFNNDEWVRGCSLR